MRHFDRTPLGLRYRSPLGIFGRGDGYAACYAINCIRTDSQVYIAGDPQWTGQHPTDLLARNWELDGVTATHTHVVVGQGVSVFSSPGVARLVEPDGTLLWQAVTSSLSSGTITARAAMIFDDYIINVGSRRNSGNTFSILRRSDGEFLTWGDFRFRLILRYGVKQSANRFIIATNNDGTSDFSASPGFPGAPGQLSQWEIYDEPWGESPIFPRWKRLLGAGATATELTIQGDVMFASSTETGGSTLWAIDPETGLDAGMPTGPYDEGEFGRFMNVAASGSRVIAAGTPIAGGSSLITTVFGYTYSGSFTLNWTWTPPTGNGSVTSVATDGTHVYVATSCSLAGSRYAPNLWILNASDGSLVSSFGGAGA